VYKAHGSPAVAWSRASADRGLWRSLGKNVIQKGMRLDCNLPKPVPLAWQQGWRTGSSSSVPFLLAESGSATLVSPMVAPIQPARLGLPALLCHRELLTTMGKQPGCPGFLVLPHKAGIISALRELLQFVCVFHCKVILVCLSSK